VLFLELATGRRDSLEHRAAKIGEHVIGPHDLAFSRREADPFANGGEQRECERGEGRVFLRRVARSIRFEVVHCSGRIAHA
jgi:hypothetical protein